MNTIWIVLSIVIAALIELALYTYLDGTIGMFLMGLVGIVGLAVLRVFLDSYRSTCKIVQPATYLYHNILDAYTILNCVAQPLDDTYTLAFDVANKDGEVSHKFIYGFAKKEKVGIKTALADLTVRTVYIPYETKGDCNV